MTLAMISFSGCQFSSWIEEKTSGNAVTDTPNGNGEGTTVGDLTGNPSTPSFPSDNPLDGSVGALYRHPLTGALTNEAISRTRPIAVCLGNTSSSMPQYGLSSASVLIEAPVEGGSTRLMALSCDYASVACYGSIRSTRDYLESLASSFDAISVHAGNSDNGEAANYQKSDPLDYISQNLTNTFYRDPSRQSPHNLMTSGALIAMAIDDAGYRATSAPILPYRIALQHSAVTSRAYSASRIDIPFSSLYRANFIYHSETGQYQYMRYQNDSVHGDERSSTQLTYRNLILLFADSVSSVTQGGNGVLTVNLNGEGTGLFCCAGMATDIVWRVSEDGIVTCYDTQGASLSADIGNTYIAIVKTSLLANVSVE